MTAIFSAPLLLYMTVTMITPGPNNLTMLFLGAEFGLKGTRRFLTASTICLFLKTLLCGLINAAFASVVPAAVPYLKWVGAGYMLYLGVMMALSGWRVEAPTAAQQTESTYRSGVILQLLNMKSWVSCLSLFAVYITPVTDSLLPIPAAALLYAAFMLASSLCWGGFGAVLRSVTTRYKKPFGILMGLSLVYCAITALL